MKKCPFCCEMIQDEAIKCKHCKELLGDGGHNSNFKQKKLTRCQNDKFIAGVCSGIAKYMEMDATVVRLLFFVVTLLTGILSGIIVYIVMAVIVPADSVD